MITHRHHTILGDIPSEWNPKYIKELLSDHYAGDWGDENGEALVNVLRSTNFTESGALDFSDVARRYFTAEKAATFSLKKGDLLLERSGGGPDQPVGRIGFVPEDLDGFTVSNFVQVLRPDTEKMVSDYLGWLLYELQRCGVIERLQQQSTQMRNLNFRDYLRLKLPYPETPEQGRISAVIRLADTALEKAQAELDATRRLKQSLIYELFTRGIPGRHMRFKKTKIGELPEEWDVVEVRRLWLSATNGLYVPENLYGDGIHIIRIDAFGDGYFATRDFKRIRINEEEAAPFRVNIGDLLINRVNSIPFLGKVVFIDRLDEAAVYESNMMRLRFNDVVLSEYLSQYLSVGFVKRRIWSMGRPAVQQLSINQRDVGKFLVALPKTDERIEIIKIIRHFREVDKKLIDRQESIKRLKKSLLQNLLTGKIRIPEGAIDVV